MLIVYLLLFIIIMILYKFCLLVHAIFYRLKINDLLENIHILEDLLYMPSKDLLNITIEVLRRKGYKVEATDKCGEFGNGLLLNDIQYASVWKHGLNQLVDVEALMNLAKCMRSNSIYRGMFITLGDFKQNTRLFCHKNVIECINGKQLLQMCKEVQKRNVALQGWP